LKPLLKTVAIIGCLFLILQTTRHAYMLWFEPRASVLDKYEKPLKDEIEAATSVDELVRRYDVVHKEADRLRAQARATDSHARFDDAEEPFKSETTLKEAIQSWEERAKDIRELRFYWFVGLLFVGAAVVFYLWFNRWIGVTFLLAGFSEFIYWTSPSFLGSTSREFDRLLLNKLVFSAVSLVLAGIVILLLGIFRDDQIAHR
jgi:hypothetical protein